MLSTVAPAVPPKGTDYSLCGNSTMGTVRCGHVFAGGSVALCLYCTHQYTQHFPQGWKRVPGDTCRHGIVRDPQPSRCSVCDS